MTEIMQLDLLSGPHLKAHGQAQVLAHNKAWQHAAMIVLEQVAARYTSFTAEDLRVGCKLAGLAEPRHVNGWGALLSCAAKRGIVRCIGYQRSERTEARGRLVSIWATKPKEID